MRAFRPRRVPALLLALALALPLPALAEGDAPAITLTPDRLELSLPAQGQATASLSAALPDGAAASDWIWRSGDQGVVTVTGSGAQATVTAVAPGQTQITVKADVALGGQSYPGVEAACTVTVLPAAVTAIALSKDHITMDAGTSESLTASLSPAGADLTTITWSSSSSSVAKVAYDDAQDRSQATVEAVSPGEAVITASSGGKSAACTVVVPGIALDRTSLDLAAGNSATIGRRVYGGLSSVVNWDSSDETVATVDASGGVTARMTGKATITATIQGTRYTAQCRVTVSENTANYIEAEADAGSPLPLSDLEEDLDDACRDVLGSRLSYVTGLSVPTQAGILYYGYASADDPGAGVGTAEKYYLSGGGTRERRLENVFFVPSVDFTGTSADISYTGFAADGSFFRGLVRVEVTKSSTINYSTSGGSPVLFQVSDFNSVCRDRNGRDLDFVSFTLPPTSKGTLYYNYSGSSLDVKVSERTNYYRSGNPSLAGVSFVPAAGATGSVTLRYSAKDARGGSYSGRVAISLSGGGLGGSGDLNYTTARNKAVTFRSTDFNDVCKEVTGQNLDRVRFDLPDASEGTLYYDYSSSSNYGSKVSSSKSYYRSSSPYVNRVSFVPKSGFSGTVTVDFTAWSTGDERFTGTVEIRVGSGSSSGGDGIWYSTPKGRALAFDADDFNDFCRDETDETLRYVRFDLPSASEGVLYYDYSSSSSYDSKVSASKSYYRSSSPKLDLVSFVPKSSFSGTAEVDFTAWGTQGGKCSGTVEIQVGGDGDAVYYSTGKDGALTFDADDFNDAAQAATGRNLKYVRFSDLPSSTRGTLYYDYSSSSSYDSKVSSSKSYYRSSSPKLDLVSFVPKSGYSGTLSFDFIGYDTSSEKFTGTVTIDVGATGSNGDLDYTVAHDGAVTFDSGDFNDFCKDELNSALRYVRFTLPPASKGTLYYDYEDDGDYDSKVSASKSYYRSSSPKLDLVSFVPDRGFAGSVDIAFTAYATNGKSCKGTVRVTAQAAPSAGAITYTAAGPVSFRAADFQAACAARGAGAFVSAMFTLPASGTGQLVYGYQGAGTGTAVAANQAYLAGGAPSLDLVSFVPASGYGGLVVIPYLGVDARGDTYSGAVQIQVAVPGASASAYFTDLGGSWTWAAASVDYLCQRGVVTGVGGGRYDPAAELRRGDFMLMLCRAFSLSAPDSGSWFTDVPADRYYAQAVRTAQYYGIAQGSGSNFYPESPLTREDAALFLLRAMRVAGRSIPDGSAASLARFPDYAKVSPYASTAMAALVEQGILQGTGSGRLEPGAVLSRAEMAVVLSRALTLPA